MNALTSTLPASALSADSLTALVGSGSIAATAAGALSLHGGSHPDAELLRIGAEMPKLMASLYTACKAHGTALEAWTEEAKTAGLTLSDDRCHALPSYAAFDQAENAMSGLIGRVQDGMDRAFDLSPRTAEGMAVWAQAAALDTSAVELHDPAEIVLAVEAADDEPIRSGFAMVVRRLVREGTAASSARGRRKASPRVDAAAEHPYLRIRRLGREFAQALLDTEGGHKCGATIRATDVLSNKEPDLFIVDAGPVEADPIFAALAMMEAWSDLVEEQSGNDDFDPSSHPTMQAWRDAATTVGRTVPITQAGLAAQLEALSADIERGPSIWQSAAARSAVVAAKRLAERGDRG